jgi:ATP-dependent DNA helicase PIF1
MSGDVHTPKILNTIVASWATDYKLRLKVRVPVMLLRNFDQAPGLCNGTQLIITKMGSYIEAILIIKFLF